MVLRRQASSAFEIIFLSRIRLFAAQREHGSYRYPLKINARANGSFEAAIAMVAIAESNRAIKPVSQAHGGDERDRSRISRQ
jgi:hypothetical protein